MAKPLTTIFNTQVEPLGPRLNAWNPPAAKPAVPAKTDNPDDLFYAGMAMAAQIYGSRVASPTRDAYNNWSRLCLSNDARQLYNAYIKVREMFSESTLNAANKRRSRGAVSKGFTHEFTNVYNSSESISAAKWANDLTRSAAEMIKGTAWHGSLSDYKKRQPRPITLADVSEQLGRYCNYPIQLQYYKSGGLRELIPMPPYTWKINSNSQFEWIDPKAAYIQYDPATGREVENGRVPAENMVWLSANHDPDLRYGFPEAYNSAVFVDSFRGLVEGLEEARINGSPFPVFLTQGKDGRGYNVEELKKLKDSFPKAMKERGQRATPFDFWRVLNGIADAKTLSVGVDFFNQFGDADLFRQHIAMSFGISIAIVLGDATFNRATLELLLRMESATQRLWAGHLTLVYIFQVFEMILDNAGIDKNLVTCEVLFDENKTPEEMISEATVAEEAEQLGFISFEGAQQKVCNYLGLKPDIEQQRGATAQNAAKLRAQAAQAPPKIPQPQVSPPRPRIGIINPAVGESDLASRIADEVAERLRENGLVN